MSAEERDEAARAEFRAQMAGVDPARLIFLDETGTTTAMARRRARASSSRSAAVTVLFSASTAPRAAS